MRGKWGLALLLVLVLAFAFAALTHAARANDVCFVSVNDTLLDLSTQPFFSGGTVYVPARVFESFRIYNSYFAADNTALLFTESKQIYFELSSGNTYDASGIYYSASGMLRNGQAYLPAQFVCSQFGLSWSFIPSDGHGDIFRLTNGTQYLTDDKFQSAASTLMDSYYSAWMGVQTTPEPSSSPEPSPEPTETPPPDRTDTEVLVSFSGLPSHKILDTLKVRGVKACFLLTAGDVAQAPDMVRRIAAEGHRLGVLCGEDARGDYERAAALLYDAARVQALIVSSDEAPEACRAMAAEAGLAFLACDVDAVCGGAGAASEPVVTSELEFSTDRVSVRFSGGGTTEDILPGILSYLRENQFSVRSPRETDAA